MFTNIARQATAASLAVFATIAVLASLNTLAVQPHAEEQLARAASPTTATQVVVIVGQRSARS